MCHTKEIALIFHVSRFIHTTYETVAYELQCLELQLSQRCNKHIVCFKILCILPLSTAEKAVRKLAAQPSEQS